MKKQSLILDHFQNSKQLFKKQKIINLESKTINQTNDTDLAPVNNTKRKRSIELQPPMLIQSNEITFPSFKKYAHLIKKLPLKYQQLEKTFNSLQTVMSYLKSRDTVAVYLKIKDSIQHSSGVEFDLDQLRKILTIYESCFEFKTVIVSINDTRVKSFTIEFPGF